MTEAEYEALYKAVETKLTQKYDALTSTTEKRQLFQKISRLFAHNAGSMSLLAALLALET